MLFNIVILLFITISTVWYAGKIINYFRKKKLDIGYVEAGKTGIDSSKSKDIACWIGRNDNYFFENNKIKASDFIIKYVDGTCMSKRGINRGDFVFAEKLPESIKDKKKIVKPNDILLIEYRLKEDKEYDIRYKIREYICLSNTNESIFETIHYREDGTPIRSGDDVRGYGHSIKDVVGIVKYIESN